MKHGTKKYVGGAFEYIAFNLERSLCYLPVNKWNAIAAMSENRVIGNGNRLPWSIPEDMAWFRKVTDSQILVLGRKTFESMKSLQPQNFYIVLTRDKHYSSCAANVEVIYSPDDIPLTDLSGRQIWICGGSEIYKATLDKCEYLYLTTIKQSYDGDAFFPAFEDEFVLNETIKKDALITIQRYKNKYR